MAKRWTKKAAIERMEQIKIKFPDYAWLAVPADHRRLPTGEIEATYQNADELRWSMRLSLWAKEVEESRPARPDESGQLTMFPNQTQHNYSED